MTVARRDRSLALGRPRAGARAAVHPAPCARRGCTRKPHDRRTTRSAATAPTPRAALGTVAASHARHLQVGSSVAPVLHVLEGFEPPQHLSRAVYRRVGGETRRGLDEIDDGRRSLQAHPWIGGFKRRVQALQTHFERHERERLGIAFVAFHAPATVAVHALTLPRPDPYTRTRAQGGVRPSHCQRTSPSILIMRRRAPRRPRTRATVHPAGASARTDPSASVGVRRQP